MSRVTAPIVKLTRAMGTAPIARASNPLLDSSAHNAGAVLMPKYAELLRRSNEHTDSSRGLTTTHRPTPQPSIANRARPLMQTFTTNAPKSAPAATTNHLDYAVLPSMGFDAVVASAGLRVPLLPDNYGAAYTVSETPITKPSISIVAANPDNVVPATPLSEVEAMTIERVDLKFIHEQPAQQTEEESGMIRDLWKGMVEDILGPAKKSA